MSLLFLISLFEYKDLFNENVKHILIIVMSIVLIPQNYFILLFFELTFSEYLYIFLRIYNIVSFVFVLFFTIHYLQKENLNLFFKFIRYFIFIFSVATIYIFLAQIFDLYEPLRNQSNTNIYGESVQSIFWLSEPHQSNGNF